MTKKFGDSVQSNRKTLVYWTLYDFELAQSWENLPKPTRPNPLIVIRVVANATKNTLRANWMFFRSSSLSSVGRSCTRASRQNEAKKKLFVRLFRCAQLNWMKRYSVPKYYTILNGSVDGDVCAHYLQVSELMFSYAIGSEQWTTLAVFALTIRKK